MQLLLGLLLARHSALALALVNSDEGGVGIGVGSALALEDRTGGEDWRSCGDLKSAGNTHSAEERLTSSDCDYGLDGRA